jgi:hypothetical protein
VRVVLLWLSTEMPLSTKGEWGMAFHYLITLKKCPFDRKIKADHISRIEAARDEKLMEEFVSDLKVGRLQKTRRILSGGISPFKPLVT